MESSENAKEVAVVEESEEIVGEEIPSPELPVSEPRDVSIESVEAKEEESDSRLEGEPSVTERPTEIVLEELGAEASVAPLTEEEVETCEALASVATEGEGGEMPLVGAVGEEEPRDMEKSEVAETTEVAPAPLLEHRASWRNCCGLLDVLKGSER